MGTFILTGASYEYILWVAVGGKYTNYSSDKGGTWTSYSNNGIQGASTSLTFGKDGSGDDLWMRSSAPTNSNSVPVLWKTSDPTDQNGWSEVTSHPDKTGSGSDKIWDVKYGNEVWVTIGRLGIKRSTDSGVTWQSTTGFSGMHTAWNMSVASDGSGTWVAVANSGNTYHIFKSTDDAQTWSTSDTHTSPSHQIDSSYEKEVKFANGIWMYITPNGGRRCTAANLSSDSWADITTPPLWVSDFKHSSGNTWVSVGSRNGRNYISTDNGDTWSANSSIAGTGNLPGIAYAGGMWIATSGDKIFKSSDDGTTWAMAVGSVVAGHIAINSVLPNS